MGKHICNRDQFVVGDDVNVAAPTSFTVHTDLQ